MKAENRGIGFWGGMALPVAFIFVLYIMLVGPSKGAWLFMVHAAGIGVAALLMFGVIGLAKLTAGIATRDKRRN